MKSKFQKIKGTYDILPPESKKWNTAVSILQSLSEQFGYEEIKTPIIENIDLFKQNIGWNPDAPLKEGITKTFDWIHSQINL